MELYPIGALNNGTKSPTLLASYGAKAGNGLPTKYGANKSFMKIAMRVPEATKQGYVDIPMGGVRRPCTDKFKDKEGQKDGR